MESEESAEDVALRNYEARPDIEARASYHARAQGDKAYRRLYSGYPEIITENIILEEGAEVN